MYSVIFLIVCHFDISYLLFILKNDYFLWYTICIIQNKQFLLFFIRRIKMISLSRQNPLSVLKSYQKDFNTMDQLLDDVFHFHGLPTLRGIDSPNFSPFLDFIEKDKEYILNIEVPGVEPDTLNLSLDENNVLVIKGEKKYTKEEEKEERYVSERYFGSFRREITMPKNANVADIDATSKNGVLRIVLPKAEEQKPKIRRIDVKNLD